MNELSVKLVAFKSEPCMEAETVAVCVRFSDGENCGRSEILESEEVLEVAEVEALAVAPVEPSVASFSGR